MTDEQQRQQAWALNRERQRAFARNSMSDDEFEARYDPQGYREKRIIALLEDINISLQDLVLPARPEPRQYDRPSRPVQPKTGAIPL